MVDFLGELRRQNPGVKSWTSAIRYRTKDNKRIDGDVPARLLDGSSGGSAPVLDILVRDRATA